MRCPGVNKACLLHYPKPCSVIPNQDSRIGCGASVKEQTSVSLYLSRANLTCVVNMPFL